MTAASAMTPKFAKKPPEEVVGNRRRALRLNAAVMQKSRDLFSLKTAHHLHEITGYSQRACEAWLSERVVIPSDALAALIQSEWGRDYLATIMAQETPHWWIRMLAWLKRISEEAEEAARARRYREMLDEEAAYATAHPTTPLFQDDTFYSGQPSPRGPMARRLRR